MIRHTSFQILIVALMVLALSQLSDGISQSVTYSIEHFSVDEGLVDHRPRSLAFHPSGYVYVGTARGLSRFDGYTFATVRLPIIDTYDYTLSYIHSVYVLPDERLFVIASKELKSELFGIVVNPSDLGCEVIGNWDDLTQLPKQIIVAGDEIDISVVPHRLSVVSLMDESGNCLFVEGVDFYSSKTATLRLQNGEEVDLSEPILSTGSYASIFGQDLSNSIYVLTNNTGLLKISVFKSDFERILANDIEEWQYTLPCRAIGSIDSKMIYGTYNKGMYVIDVDGSTTLHESFESENGEARIVPYELRGIHPLNDSIVLATSLGNGVMRINLNSLTASSLIDEELMHSIQLNDGNVLVTGLVENVPTLILVNTLTSDVELIALSDLGWERYISESLLTQTSNGDIWLGTTDALMCIDLKGRRIKKAYVSTDDQIIVDRMNFPVRKVLTASHIIALQEYDGNLWIGLFNAGMNILDLESEVVEVINKESGLTNNTVCTFLPDSLGMWIGTYNGLTFYNVRANTMSHFSTQNGLSHNEFNRWSGFISSSGKYYFGTMNGVTAFSPEVVLNSNQKTKVLLAEVGHYDNSGTTPVVENYGLEGSPTFTLPANNRSFYAKVALTDFRKNDLNSYSYKLEPITGSVEVNNQWRSNGNDRTIQFEYLPAGKYQLSVRGVSVSGVAVSDPLVLFIEVKEFFYKSEWFLISFLCLVILGLWSIYRYRLNQVLKVERLRTRLSSDLHDDVGGLLSGVAFQMEVLESTVSDANKPLVRRIAHSSRAAMEKMRDVVWAIDARQQTIQDLQERMLEFADEVLAPLDKKYVIRVNGIPSDLKLTSEVRHNLLLIYKEFVNNAIKHADCDSVQADFMRVGRGLSLHIYDDGIGYDISAAKGTGQGLANMRLRAERLNGNIEFTNSDGFGVRITVTIV